MAIIRSLVALCSIVMGLLPPITASAQNFDRLHEGREAFISGGRRIRVDTFAPAGNGRHPAVLILYTSVGTLAGKSDFVRLSRALAAQGKVAFFVRYFDRTGTIIAGNRAIDRLTPVWISTVSDAVTFAAAHPRVDRSKIGIFGYSLGAYLAVAVSSTDPRIDTVVEIAGGIFKGYAVCMKRFPPALILHGSADRRVPVARAFELARAGRRLGASPQMRIYQGEGHRLSKVASQDAFERTLEFFGKHLGTIPLRQ